MSSDSMSNDSKHQAEDAMLEALFAQAQQEPAALPQGLEARILADAAAVQGTQDPVVAIAPERRGVLSWLAEVRDGLGGWPSVAGLSCAMVTGLWVGNANPDWLLGVPGIDGASLATDLLAEDDLDLLFPASFAAPEGA